MDNPNVGARSHHNEKSEARLTRRQLMFAGAAATATFGIWTQSKSGSSSSGEADTLATTPPPTAPTSIAPTPQTEATPPPTTAPFEPLDHDLHEGMVDSKVEALQALLARKRFDPGPIDGIFGGATKRAVWAFEKLLLHTPRERMRGVVTPDIWQQMNEDVRVAPRRSPGGNHMEVYLPEQVSVLFFNGEARVISHVSSGEGITWCDEVEIDLENGTTELKGICGKAVTPGGVYHFERKVEGWRNAKLGRLYKPVYFNYGIAIHGAGNVPDYPASRGCVRHPMHIADYIQDLISIGDAIYVFDGVEEPETYGAQPMIFDWPDPDWIPPTTTTIPETTTTTTTTTTAAPAPTATVPATTTAPSPSTSIPPSSSTTVPPASSTVAP